MRYAGGVLKRDYANQYCPVASTLEVVGERWTLLIIRDVFLGIRRFEELQRDLGVARNVLQSRLERLLEEGILVFKHHLTKSLVPALGVLGELGYDSLVPHGEWAVTAVENAEDQFKMGRYPQTVSALEMALMNFHEVANGLLPPEEEV